MLSPVWTPIGSTFSIEQMMMALSSPCRGRPPFRILFQPSTDSSDQNFLGRRCFEAACNDPNEFVAIVGNASARTSESEAGIGLIAGNPTSGRGRSVLLQGCAQWSERGLSSPILSIASRNPESIFSLLDGLRVPAPMSSMPSRSRCAIFEER